MVLFPSVRLFKRLLLSCLLLLVFGWSYFSVNWSADLIHAGGTQAIMQIAKGLILPDFSPGILLLGLRSTWITLTYAVAGMTFAIIYSFCVGILASGVLTSARSARIFSKLFFRGVLGFTRSIHELIWAWLFVATIGLSPYAAIFALAIPYGGILGRIFADMLNDVPKEPIIALKSSGASRLQLLFYGYLPLVSANMISYTMYRFECAIRSSAIMSFVGLGGLGYQIQLSLADLKYDQAWTYVYFLILLVVLVDSWSHMIRKGLREQNARKRLHLGWIYTLFVTFLVIIVWGSNEIGKIQNLMELFSEQNATHAKTFFAGMIGNNNPNPAFLSWSSWSNALKLTLETIKMSILAIGFAAIAAFLTVIPTMRNVFNGSRGRSRTLSSRILLGLVRVVYLFSRSVPELIWAMMIIFILKPGILPGAIALALHNFGILGKLWAEVIEDIEPAPIQTLAATGASKPQLFFYGILPTVLPKFLTYFLYRWEVIMRTTIVVGFVGAGGLGVAFKLAMSYFQYTSIALLLICYIALVILADFASESIRKAVK